MLKLGNINILKVYIGNSPAQSGYLGDVKIWGQSDYGYKARLTLSDGSTVDIPFVDADDHTLLRSETDEYLGNLLSAEVFDGVTTIGNDAFGGSLITAITLPNTLTAITDRAFHICNRLTSITIPNSVTEIGYWTFYGCSSLTSITIPANVTSVGERAFAGCSSLTSITCEAATPPDLYSNAFDDTNNCPIYVPCEAVDAYKTAWSMYEDRISCQRDYMTPEFVVYYSKEDDTRDYVIFNPALVNLVDKIGVNDGTGWAEYDVPSDGIFSQDIINNGGGMLGIKLKTSTALDTSLFDSTDFREIDGINVLDTAAPWTRVYNSTNSQVRTDNFEWLINLPDTVQRIEDWACAGFIVSLPDGQGGFEMSRLPNACTYIGDYAFEFAKLMNDDSIPFEIPSRITHIGEFAFEGAYLPKTINFNATIGVPDEFMFQVPMYISNVNIAEGNTSIGTGAFHSGAIKDFSLPSTLRTIGEDAFYGVRMQDGEGDNGSGITIPASVTSIGSYAFQNAGIPAIYFEGATPATIGDDVFTDCVTPDNTPTPIYVPCEAVDSYKAAAGWSTYADRIQCIPEPEPPEASEYFHFISLKNGSQVKANSKFQYSLDGGNTWTAGDNAMKTLNSGNTIYFKGVNTTALGQDPFGILFQSALSPTKLEVRGNIMSLCYGDHFEEYTTILANGFFKRLFGSSDTDNPTLVRADKLYLPSTTLTSECYAEMFRHCNVLRTAPSLPATTLAANCYDKMFANCTSLTTAPSELPATTLEDSCYYQMFARCTSLTTAPTISATVLSENCCYDMFSNCTSLKKAPALPATTLAKNCYYNMFYNCTSLTGTPELPATTLAENCYRGMFEGCSGLTSASTLSATTLAKYCYRWMFYDCASLVTAPNLPATTLADYCYYQMFWRCTSLTSIPSILPATTLANGCYSGMFGGCTGVTTAPELPATTLTASCYENMFNGCTSLSVAPELSAITLVEKCYGNMFKNCGNINYIKAMFTTEPSSSYTENWLYNAFPVGTFVKNSAATWDVRGANGIPEGWTVQTADA